MKNPFKKSKKFPTQSAPRSMEDLNKVHGELTLQLGAAQYRQFVLGEEIKQLNAALMQVNQEGYRRQELDKEIAKNQPKSEESKNE